MEAKKSILKEMVEGIKVCRNDTVWSFNHYIKEILQSRTVEEVMRSKKDLLVSLVGEVFPLFGDTCYFCIETNGDCKICKFAKFHKKCEGNEKSDYRKIVNLLDKLEGAFKNYYKGEVYPEDAIPTKESRNRKKNDKHPG